MQATYTKLKSGDWGIRVLGVVAEGSSITVTKKSGETRTEVIRKVLWFGNGISLCAIGGAGADNGRGGTGARHSSRGTRTGCSCGSVEEFERASDCASCQHDR